MARWDLRQHSLIESIIQSIYLNRTIAAIALVYAGSLLFLRFAPFAPLPFQSSLATPPDWVSWFDAYVTFPILIILCLLPFRSSRQGSITLLCAVAIIPLYLVFASYYFFYAQTPLGLFALVTPLTLLVPTLILIVILVAPLINSLILSRNMISEEGNGIQLRLDGLASKLYFSAIACLSIGLAFLQAYLRSTISGVALTGWVSDIGITVDAGARDLVHGINPYTHGLPPWGGPGITYGPVTYLLAVPFTFLPSGWAAHVSALFYALLTSTGIWKCMQQLAPKVAAYSAALFLALPTTSWAIEGGMTSHIGIAAIIVWSLFMFFTARYFWSGVTASLGLLALGIPGLLIIPFVIGARSRVDRLKTLAGFVVPLVLVLAGVLAVFPPRFLLTEIAVAGNALGYGWLTPDLIFSSTFIKALSVITTGWLVFWLLYRSLKIRNDDKKILATIATFLLLVPFTAANYFAFFYVWGSAVALMAVISHIATRERLIGTSSQTMEVLK
jgi:hypothetical protein